jgi:DNA-binding winged helix-turn-helix (wHTH) protein
MRIRFGPFTLDRETRQVVGATEELHLAPKAFDLLVLLIEHRPKVLSKADLQQALWPDTFVVEANLSNLVAEIRQALGDHAKKARFVRTVHGVGYSFCGETTAVPETRAAETSPAGSWLEWGERRFPLASGENVIGRDADVAVRLEESTVSRRHARIVIDAGRALLEDFSSKNGTYCRDTRVAAPVELADGDAIRIGSILLTFHARAPFGTTETQAGTA